MFPVMIRGSPHYEPYSQSVLFEVDILKIRDWRARISALFLYQLNFLIYFDTFQNLVFLN